MTSSIAGIQALGTELPYVVSNAGIIKAVRVLAKLVGQDGIQVNAIVPGKILFPGGIWERDAASRPEVWKRWIDREVAMKRFGGVKELADAVLWLDMVIDAPDQVWCADITYIRMVQGFVYLVAIMDWYSRYVVAWEISLFLDKAFCIAALERALTMSKPGIFNTDQGAQFTSREFMGTLAHAGIRISMDGRGRVLDNIFIERLWRTIKYEEVYLHEYRTVSGARRQLDRYFRFYNAERIHEALWYRTPSEVYFREPARMGYSA